MHGLYLLWWVGERGISPAIVATILAVGDLALIRLELPTGWFADRRVAERPGKAVLARRSALTDRRGHRTSLIVGSSVQALGMLACWRGRGVPELIAAAVLVALGDAFRSGADEALLYRTCIAVGREDDFQRIEARTRAAGLTALVGLLLAGGLIVTMWGFAAGWAVETALCALGLAIACAMVEPPALIADPQPDRSEREPGKERALRRPRRMAMLILPAALLGGLASASSFLAQTEGTMRPDAVTVLVAVITLAEAAGAALAAQLSGADVRGPWLLAAGGVALAGATVGLPSGMLIAAVALSFILGLVHPLRATLLQRAAADHARARVASLASACDMASSAIALSWAGAWRSSTRRVRI